MPHNLSPFSFQFSPPLARHYHSDLSIWLSVDPMSDKYPGVSPYAYCANNPVRLVDPNGEDIYKPGVRIYFFNGDIGIGISYALSANMVSGIARDKGGVTRFQANSFNYIVNQNLNENSSKPSCFIGFDLSITAHAIWDWSANSFDDFVGKQLNTINLGVGPSASLTGGDCFIGIGIGGGYGGGYDIETLNVKRSISLSYNEVKRIKKLSNIVGFPIWEVANQKKISNENGVPVGFSATIQTYDINNNPIPTGISIYCGVDDRGCPDNRWKSKEYDIDIR